MFSQVYMPLLAIIILIGCLIYMLRRKRWRSKLSWITITIGVFAGALPFLMLFSGATYPAKIENTNPHLSIRVPLDGLVNVAWGGDKTSVNYHAAHPDQRWAYDLVIEPYMSGSENLYDYGCYGKPVLAPISGEVVSSRDDLPDETPNVTINEVFTGGNTVLIRPEGQAGTLVIAHLKPKSLTVKTGDHVTEGEIIGQCGNSGNTSEPHVHIHYAKLLLGVEEDWLAYGLPLFFRDHQGPEMPEGGIIETDGEVLLTGDIIQHSGKKTKELVD